MFVLADGQTWRRPVGEAVGCFDCDGCDFDLGGLEAGACGRDSDGAGRSRGADGDAIDAALGLEVEVVGGVELAAVVAAAPDGGAGACEVDTSVVGGAALALCVEDLDVDECGVLSVGLEACGVDDGGEFDLGWSACCVQLLRGDELAGVFADGAKVAGGECDVGEGEDPAALGFGVDACGFAVDEEFDGLGVGDDVDGFGGGWWGRSSGGGCGGRARGSG